MIENHSKIDPGALATAFGDANDLASVLKIVPEELGACLGCPGVLLNSSRPFFARPERPKIGSGAAFGRQKAVLNTSGRVPETALDAQDGPRWIFGRFGGHPARIFVDVRMLFRQFSFEPSATERQNRNLKKESCDPQRTSWPLRCALASYCSHVFRNDFRTLHVQPFFVASPQAHLVYILSLIHI